MDALALANTVVAVRGRRVDLLEPELGLTELRDAIRELFAAATGGAPAPSAPAAPPPPTAVALVNALARAPQLAWAEGGTPALEAESAAAEAARTAIELVAGGRLRRCGNPRCVQFFLADGRRAYCGEACANRTRVARHGRRARPAAEG
jgi:predicted RNA-binding Zn ribbon-like protein